MKNIKKMKKVSIKLTTIPLLMSLCSFKVNNDYDKELVNNIFTSLTYMDEGFKGSSISTPIKLIDNNDQSCLLFKTYLNNKYTGYFILDNNYELLISHVDSLDYYQDVEDYYYLTDIFTISKDRKEITSKSNVKIRNIINKSSSYLDDVSLADTYDNVLKTYSSSYGSSMYIEGVPSYYNSPDEKYVVFPGGGCVPTAAAMLLSFYDRNCSYFSSLYTPDLPLNHDEDVDRVNSVIKELGNDMLINSEGGVPDNRTVTGISTYLIEHGKQAFKADYYCSQTANAMDSNDVIGLSSSFIARKNIALLGIDSNYSSNKQFVEDHVVVLTGYGNYQYVGASLYVNFGWSSRFNNYNISPKAVYSFMFIRNN